MGSLDFVASLVRSLSWPTVVVIAVFIFRRPIAGLIKSIKSYEGFGQKIDFGKGVAQVETKLEGVSAASWDEISIDELALSSDSTEVPDIAVGDAGAGTLEAYFVKLLRSVHENPSFAVMVSWRILEKEILALHEESSDSRDALAPMFAQTKSIARRISDLGRRKLLGNEVISAIRLLRRLRNQVAHSVVSPSVGSAIAYIEATELTAVEVHSKRRRLPRSR